MPLVGLSFYVKRIPLVGIGLAIKGYCLYNLIDYSWWVLFSLFEYDSSLIIYIKYRFFGVLIYVYVYSTALQ